MFGFVFTQNDQWRRTLNYALTVFGFRGFYFTPNKVYPNCNKNQTK